MAGSGQRPAFLSADRNPAFGGNWKASVNTSLRRCRRRTNQVAWLSTLWLESTRVSTRKPIPPPVCMACIISGSGGLQSHSSLLTCWIIHLIRTRISKSVLSVRARWPSSLGTSFEPWTKIPQNQRFKACFGAEKSQLLLHTILCEVATLDREPVGWFRKHALTLPHLNSDSSFN